MKENQSFADNTYSLNYNNAITIREQIDKYRIQRRRLCLQSVYMALANSIAVVEYIISKNMANLDDYEWMVMLKYDLKYSD